jgi:DNA-binding transcriptional LysR family regulator
MNTSLLGIAPRYFLEVARCGSVTLAAERLHVAPSAVSRQISQLEQELGCQLFERKARGMEPSAAGQRLAAHLQSSSLEAERTLDAMHGLASEHRARVRIACTDGFAAGFMAQAMADFRGRHAPCAVQLHVDHPDAVSQRLLRGECDLALKFAVAPEPGLRVEHQQTAQIMAFVAPGHALAARRSITPEQLTQHPLGLPEPGTTVRQMLDLCCTRQGLHYQEAFTGNYATLLAIAAQGACVTLSALVSAAHAVRAGAVVGVPVDAPEFHQRSFQLLSLSGQSLRPMAALMRDHLIALATSSNQALRPSPRRRKATP